jgi:DNA-binding response OmpR family regulator
VSHILLLDDSPFALALTQAALEAAGFDVAMALDLATFEAELRRRSPDLILVDVQMPEAFGDDVAATLRGFHGITTPIFLLSNLEEGELARRAREAEVDGYISKRHGLDAIVAQVQRVLGGTVTGTRGDASS